MRKLLISSLVLAAAAALAIAATATGARGTSAAPAAIPGCAVDSLNLVEEGVLYKRRGIGMLPTSAMPG